MKWEDTPRKDGWYWHRFRVSGVPIHNTCYVRHYDGRVFVHYLGEASEEPFKPEDSVAYWGPLEIPPD